MSVLVVAAVAVVSAAFVMASVKKEGSTTRPSDEDDAVCISGAVVEGVTKAKQEGIDPTATAVRARNDCFIITVGNKVKCLIA